MSNDLVKFGGGGLPANPDELVKGLQNVNQSLQGSTGGVPFLRLLKSGYYAYGPENIEPEEGARWAVNPYSLMHGFACWGDGELLGERMVPFNQPVPPRSELPDYGQEWGQQVSMQLQCLDGEDTGVSVLYKGTSTGLRNAVKKLIDQIIAQAQIDQQHIVPVLDLGVDSYNHKKYGEIFFPVLTVQDWISIDDGESAPEQVEDQSEGEPAPDDGGAAAQDGETEAPASGSRRRRRRAAAESEGKPADDAPTQSSNRRRRRRQS